MSLHFQKVAKILSKKSNFCVFCYCKSTFLWQHQEHNKGPLYEKVRNFFFNSKISHDLEVILLHAKAVLIVEIPNINPYFIAFGRSTPSLSTTKPQSKVMFFENFIFAP